MLRRTAAAAAGRPEPSRLASTTPTTAVAMPTTCSAAGRSPLASPTITGTTTPVAEIGATIDIVPIARAR